MKGKKRRLRQQEGASGLLGKNNLSASASATTFSAPPPAAEEGPFGSVSSLLPKLDKKTAAGVQRVHEAAQRNVLKIENVLKLAAGISCRENGIGSKGGHIARELKAPGPHNGHHKVADSERFLHGNVQLSDEQKSKLLGPQSPGLINLPEWNKNHTEGKLLSLVVKPERQLRDALFHTEIAKYWTEECAQALALELYGGAEGYWMRVFTGIDVDTPIKPVTLASSSPSPPLPYSSDVAESVDGMATKAVIIPVALQETGIRWYKKICVMRKCMLSLQNKDFLDLTALREPPEYVISMVSYLCILLGLQPTWQAAKRSLFHELLSLVTFLKEVEPLTVPVKRLKKAIKLKAAKLSDLSMFVIKDVCRSPCFAALAKWILCFNEMAEAIVEVDAKQREWQSKLQSVYSNISLEQASLEGGEDGASAISSLMVNGGGQQPLATSFDSSNCKDDSLAQLSLVDSMASSATGAQAGASTPTAADLISPNLVQLTDFFENLTRCVKEAEERMRSLLLAESEKMSQKAEVENKLGFAPPPPSISGREEEAGAPTLFIDTEKTNTVSFSLDQSSTLHRKSLAEILKCSPKKSRDNTPSGSPSRASPSTFREEVFKEEVYEDEGFEPDEDEAAVAAAAAAEASEMERLAQLRIERQKVEEERQREEMRLQLQIEEEERQREEMRLQLQIEEEERQREEKLQLERQKYEENPREAAEAQEQLYDEEFETLEEPAASVEAVLAGASFEARKDNELICKLESNYEDEAFDEDTVDVVEEATSKEDREEDHRDAEVIPAATGTEVSAPEREAETPLVLAEDVLVEEENGTPSILMVDSREAATEQAHLPSANLGIVEQEQGQAQYEEDEFDAIED